MYVMVRTLLVFTACYQYVLIYYFAFNILNEMLHMRDFNITESQHYMQFVHM